MNIEQKSIKIVFFGNPGVGKTAIISKYVNEFGDINSPTIGANYLEKIVKKNGKEYELNIWDTPGQTKFNSLGKHYYKEWFVAILLYDIQSQESLEALKNEWYPDLLKYGEKYTIKAVVGHEKYLGAFESDCLTDEEYAKQFAKEIGASFHIVSSYSGYWLFNSLIDRFLSPEFTEKYNEMMKMKEIDNPNLIKEEKKRKRGYKR